MEICNLFIPLLFNHRYISELFGSGHIIEALLYIAFYIGAVLLLKALFGWIFHSRDQTNQVVDDNIRKRVEWECKRKEEERKQRESQEEYQRKNTFYVSPDGTVRTGTEKNTDGLHN